MKPGAVGLGLIIALASASPGRAAEKELAFLLGFRFGGEMDTVGVDPVRQIDLDGDPAFGAAFGYRIRPDGWVTVLWSHEESEFDPGSIFGGGRSVDLHVDYLHAGGLYRPRREGRLEPFVMATGGLTFFSTTNPDFGDEEGFSIAVGGGARLPLGQRTALRFEARGYVTFEDAVFTGLCGSTACTLELAGDGAVQLETLVGLIYGF